MLFILLLGCFSLFQNVLLPLNGRTTTICKDCRTVIEIHLWNAVEKTDKTFTGSWIDITYQASSRVSYSQGSMVKSLFMFFTSFENFEPNFFFVLLSYFSFPIGNILLSNKFAYPLDIKLYKTPYTFSLI